MFYLRELKLCFDFNKAFLIIVVPKKTIVDAVSFVWHALYENTVRFAKVLSKNKFLNSF